MTSNGKNGNSQRVGPMPTNGSSYNGAKMNTVPVEDEELDRGHWGSKAEFILSCIGFSVSFIFQDMQSVKPIWVARQQANQNSIFEKL